MRLLLPVTIRNCGGAWRTPTAASDVKARLLRLTRGLRDNPDKLHDEAPACSSGIRLEVPPRLEIPKPMMLTILILRHSLDINAKGFRQDEIETIASPSPPEFPDGNGLGSKAVVKEDC